MRFLALTVSLTALAFVSANLLASATLALLARWRPGAWSRLSANALLALRLLPGLAAVWVAFGMVLPAFLVHEPRITGERIGPLGWAIPLAGLAGGWGLARATAAMLATSRLLRSWRRAGREDGRELALPVTRLPDLGPVAAVAGILRPRLYVSEGLRRSLTDEEWGLVRAHEAAHAASRDNLKAVVLRAAPDALGPLGAAPLLERLWARAAEQEADAAAVRSIGALPCDLAGVLLKVARLWPSAQRLAAATVPGFFGADSLALRVARLLDREPAPEPLRHAPRLSLLLLLAGLGLALLSEAALPKVHGVAELIVRAAQP
jgi:Zn-dependent protease with chaperone function